ncbi:MAG: agmatine deiminase family protein [Pseudomonadota bacterium]
MRFEVVSVVLVALQLVACDFYTTTPRAPAGAPANAATEAPGLPAWETPMERAGARKGDEHDDYREAHPEIYGVTAPPSEPVRSFAEFEPVQAMVMRPGGSISQFHQGILQGAAGHVPLIVLFHETGQAGGLEVELDDLGLDLDGFQLLDVGDTDAIWTRDYGPISHVTLDGEIGFADFRYYHGRHWDDAIPAKLAASWGVNAFRPSMSYEGGNFMADAQGTCYATEKIYQQNAGHTKSEVDQWMSEYAGCKQLVTLIWPKGLGTGHIDMFAKLMDETTVILGEYDPALQPQNAAILDDNAALLEALTTAGSKSLEIFRIPMPWDETKVWYTYTNALILNDMVLVPVYSKFKDLEAQALEVYEAAAPQLSIWTVNSDSIIPSGGAIHCVTMTVPAGALVAYQEAPVQLCHLNEINDCEDLGPCGGLPYEGACDGEVLQYCGADGYPHAASCDACCGWAPDANGGLGWFDCLAEPSCEVCADECDGDGDAGCSAVLTHAWSCGQADDDPCRERLYEACGETALCNPTIASCQEGFIPPDPCDEPPCGEACDHECEVVGARTCDDEGAAALICRVDGDGCRALELNEACEAGTGCVDGVCVTWAEPAVMDLVSEQDVIDPEGPEGPEGKGGGCGVGGEVVEGSWLFLLLLLVAASRPHPRGREFATCAAVLPGCPRRRLRPSGPRRLRGRPPGGCPRP